MWNKHIHFLLVDDLINRFIFQITSFIFNLLSTSQIYSIYNQRTEKYDLLCLQRRNPVDSRFWSRLCYYYSKMSRSKFNDQLTRSTPSCLAIAVVPKARIFRIIICHECQSLRTKKENWRWETKYSPVWGLKTWTLAAIKYPISMTNSSIGKLHNWTWMQFSNQG